MLKPKPLGPIPVDTKQIGEQLLGAENLMRRIGDEYAELVKDEDFAAMYSHTGQPALSPAMLILICILQAMEHLSDRMTVAMVATRIDWKYALHLPLSYKSFDASVLTEFRERLIKNKSQRLIFDRVLEKMKAEGFLKGRVVQRTDSLTILGSVRELNRLELVMETMRLALEEIAEKDKEWLVKNLPSSWLETYGERAQAERIVKESGPKAKAETERLLLQTGRDGFKLLELIGQAESHIKELDKIALLKKIWSQQYRIVEKKEVEIKVEENLSNENVVGEQSNGRWDKEIALSTSDSRAKEGVEEMIETPHDPELRYCQKRGKEYVGYKLQLTETATETEPAIITDVEVVSGSAYDGNSLASIHARLQERDLLPQTHLGDGNYISGDLIVESQNRGIDLLGPINPNTSLVSRLAEGFSVENFQIDFDNKQAVCPGGQTAKGWSETINGNGRQVFQILWEKKVCDNCPFKDKCVQGTKMGRTIKISRNYQTIIDRRKLQQTPEFQDRYRRRAGVEATFSHMVNCCDARHTLYRGKAKTELRFIVLAVGLNIKRVVDWDSGLRPQRKRSPKLKKLTQLAAA